jgi:hypothetical protein
MCCQTAAWKPGVRGGDTAQDRSNFLNVVIVFMGGSPHWPLSFHCISANSSSTIVFGRSPLAKRFGARWNKSMHRGQHTG